LRVLERMSLERVIKILERLGFSRVDAEVYVYLAKTGPKEGREVTIGLRMTKQQLYHVLRHLKKKGVVTSIKGHPNLFSALDFKELLKLYIELNQQQAQSIEEVKKEVLESWRDMEPHKNN
jgi:HTH-type transcriptional regulator, sugar sensing transcriptional regulator